jgi:prepilin-type processing-associated H-X9-DG protein
MDADAVDSGQVVVRSLHVGGVYAAMADGSVRFISDFVETGAAVTGGYVDGSVTGFQQNFSVWQRLNVSADGMVFELPGS